MALPHTIARFNRRVTNRWIEPVVRRTDGYLVVRHRGRRTGNARSTPLYGFESDGGLLVVLTYGTRADWFRNVQAGGGSVERDGVMHTIAGVEAIDRTLARSSLPRSIRLALGVFGVHDLARLTLQEA